MKVKIGFTMIAISGYLTDSLDRFESSVPRGKIGAIAYGSHSYG